MPARCLLELLLLALHVGAGLAHGLDDLVERDLVRAVAAQRHARGVDRLDGAHGVALDARDLHQAADRVAGQAEVVLHADLGGVLDLLRRAAEHRGERRRRPSSRPRRPPVTRPNDADIGPVHSGRDGCAMRVALLRAAT